MSDAQDLKRLAEKMDIEDLLLRYWDAVDIEMDVEAIINCFTTDCELDYSGLGFKIFRGAEEIYGFFNQHFANVEWQIHQITNFHIVSRSGNEAQARSYLIGRACHKGGTPIETTGCCNVDFVYTGTEWKIRRIQENAIVPMSAPVTDILNL